MPSGIGERNIRGGSIEHRDTPVTVMPPPNSIRSPMASPVMALARLLPGMPRISVSGVAGVEHDLRRRRQRGTQLQRGAAGEFQHAGTRMLPAEFQCAVGRDDRAGIADRPADGAEARQRAGHRDRIGQQRAAAQRHRAGLTRPSRYSTCDGRAGVDREAAGAADRRPRRRRPRAPRRRAANRHRSG